MFVVGMPTSLGRASKWIRFKQSKHLESHFECGYNTWGAVSVFFFIQFTAKHTQLCWQNIQKLLSKHSFVFGGAQYSFKKCSTDEQKHICILFRTKRHNVADT